MSGQLLHTNVTDLKPDAGLRTGTRSTMAKELRTIVADTYRLMINTHGLHWNVEGPLFYSLHKLTEQQYTDLFEAVDDLAERVRALGLAAPATSAQMWKYASIDDVPEEHDLKGKVEALIDMHESLAQRMRGTVRLAETLDDLGTADLMTKRIGIHEKHAWMLRATIAS